MTNILSTITLDKENHIQITTTKEFTNPMKGTDIDKNAEAVESVVSILLEKALTKATEEIYKSLEDEKKFNKLIREAVTWASKHSETELDNYKDNLKEKKLEQQKKLNPNINYEN